MVEDNDDNDKEKEEMGRRGSGSGNGRRRRRRRRRSRASTSSYLDGSAVISSGETFLRSSLSRYLLPPARTLSGGGRRS